MKIYIKKGLGGRHWWLMPVNDKYNLYMCIDRF
jgi:hypothetical protein